MARNFWLLTIFTCGLFGAESFWFSYKVATENRTVVYEERNISSLMQVVDVKKYKFLCQLDVSKKKYRSAEYFLNKNFDKLLECFYPMSTNVVNYTVIETKGIIEKTVLIIIPTKFIVEFKGQFANIKTIE
ncbi:MAG: hypothetical protein JJV95_04175 [Sulfurospirillum sp.]|nr:hypothetical protein [Sulfurospirillum sp.]MBL0703159.1 hypothetical protein [Sulfurospirillum sp.]